MDLAHWLHIAQFADKPDERPENGYRQGQIRDWLPEAGSVMARGSKRHGPSEQGTSPTPVVNSPAFWQNRATPFGMAFQVRLSRSTVESVGVNLCIQWINASAES